MNPFSLVWGVIIVIIGVVFLGINVGWWNNDVWSVLWRFWPLLLILIGLRMLVRNSVAFFLIALGTLALIAWLLMMYAIAPTATSSSRAWDFGWQWHMNAPEREESGTFQQTQSWPNNGTLVIDLGGHYNITATGNDSETVEVNLSGPKRAIDRLELVRTGDRIALREKSGMSWFNWTTGEVTGTVTFPKAGRLDLSLGGVTELEVRNHTSEVAINNSGSSTVSFSNSVAHNPRIDVSGVGKVRLDQCTGASRLSVSGASDVTAANCTLQSLEIDASGAGKVTITSGTITDATIDSSGASTIQIPRPTGKIDQDSSGAAKIEYR